jgi:hypothetical protein
MSQAQWDEWITACHPCFSLPQFSLPHPHTQGDSSFWYSSGPAMNNVRDHHSTDDMTPFVLTQALPKGEFPQTFV